MLATAAFFPLCSLVPSPSTSASICLLASCFNLDQLPCRSAPARASTTVLFVKKAATQPLMLAPALRCCRRWRVRQERRARRCGVQAGGHQEGRAGRVVGPHLWYVAARRRRAQAAGGLAHVRGSDGCPHSCLFGARQQAAGSGGCGNNSPSATSLPLIASLGDGGGVDCCCRGAAVSIAASRRRWRVPESMMTYDCSARRTPEEQWPKTTTTTSEQGSKIEQEAPKQPPASEAPRSRSPRGRRRRRLAQHKNRSFISDNKQQEVRSIICAAASL